MNPLAPFQLFTGGLTVVGLVFCLLLTIKSSFRNNPVSMLFLGGAILTLIATIIYTLDAFFSNQTLILIQIGSPINYMGAALSFSSVSYRYSMFLSPVAFSLKHPFVRSTPKMIAILYFTVAVIATIARSLYLSIGPFSNPTLNNISQRAAVIIVGSMGIVDLLYVWSIIRMVHMSKKSLVQTQTNLKSKIIAFIIMIVKMGVISLGIGLFLWLNQNGTIHHQVISAHAVGLYVVTDGAFIFLFRNIATSKDTKKMGSASSLTGGKKSVNPSNSSQVQMSSTSQLNQK
jgi:hypothetical protein